MQNTLPKGFRLVQLASLAYLHLRLLPKVVGGEKKTKPKSSSDIYWDSSAFLLLTACERPSSFNKRPASCSIDANPASISQACRFFFFFVIFIFIFHLLVFTDVVDKREMIPESLSIWTQCKNVLYWRFWNLNHTYIIMYSINFSKQSLIQSYSFVIVTLRQSLWLCDFYSLDVNMPLMFGKEHMISLLYCYKDLLHP